VGLWLHPDDLSPEIGPLAALAPVAVAAFGGEASQQEDSHLSASRLDALRTVVGDGIARAAVHYSCPASLIDVANPALSLAEWADSHQLTEIVAFAPSVGPVGDLATQLSEKLGAHRLTLVRRPSDAHAFALASAGFFPFWEKMARHLQHSAS